MRPNSDCDGFALRRVKVKCAHGNGLVSVPIAEVNDRCEHHCPCEGRDDDSSKNKLGIGTHVACIASRRSGAIRVAGRSNTLCDIHKYYTSGTEYNCGIEPQIGDKLG